MNTLRALLTERIWFYGLGFDLDIDFCFWILERDGLQISPFDRHGEGDGELRAAGLDPTSWSAWFTRGIAAVDERSAIITSRRSKKIDFERLRALEPAALWNGAPAVGRRLAALAEAYEEILGEREQIKLELARQQAAWSAQLWKDLAPYRRVLPPVSVFVICYPGPVLHVVQPKTIILAVGGWTLTSGGLADSIMRGMQSLAEGSRVRPQAGQMPGRIVHRDVLDGTVDRPEDAPSAIG